MKSLKAIDAKRNELERRSVWRSEGQLSRKRCAHMKAVVKNDGTTEDRPVLIRFVGDRVEIKKDGTKWSVLTNIGYSDREPNSRLYKECKRVFHVCGFL